MAPKLVNRSVAGLLALSAATLLNGAWAQDDTVPLAPRIDGRAPPAISLQPSAAPAPTPGPLTLTALRPPTPTQLAPLPEQRDSTPEEVIVIGKGWRLPNLGSDWREQQEAARREGRLNATWLPLYDPERPPLHSDVLPLSPEARRQGYIELFQLRFGHRPSD